MYKTMTCARQLCCYLIKTPIKIKYKDLSRHKTYPIAIATRYRTALGRTGSNKKLLDIFFLSPLSQQSSRNDRNKIKINIKHDKI